MKVRVPTSWEDVTLRQFIELSKVPDMGFSKEDANLRILSILTGIDDSELYELPVGELAKINALVKFIESKDSLFPVKYKIKIKDKRYKFEWKTNLLTSGEYIDIQEYLKSKNDNLHKILAIYLKPINIFGFRIKSKYKKNIYGKYIQTLESREETAQFLLDNITMDKVFAMSGFFLQTWGVLMKATQAYLAKEKNRAMKAINLSKEDLLKFTGGI